jgi:hypothetical protein
MRNKILRRFNNTRANSLSREEEEEIIKQVILMGVLFISTVIYLSVILIQYLLI